MKRIQSTFIQNNQRPESHSVVFSGSIAQLVERWIFNPWVAGSNPARQRVEARKLAF